MTDYATRILAQLFNESEPVSAVELAEKTLLPLPTVSKLLKKLTHAHILQSYRGSLGGYVINESKRDARIIEIIQAVDGPVAITSCSGEEGCDHQEGCITQPGWIRVNRLVISLLSKMRVSDLLRKDQQPDIELLWSEPSEVLKVINRDR